jgi:endonuclease-3 related protein
MRKNGLDEKGMLLYTIYKKLFAAFGPQHWWPGDTPFEVAVGAILTQNTSWGNVEKAISNLKAKGAFDPFVMRRMQAGRLAELLRPSGYFNVKARRLKSFISFLVEDYGGRVEAMKKEKTSALRKKLLSVNGIGPETADSILLYALGKPVFVVDAYTKRVLERHDILPDGGGYEEVQGFFLHSSLKKNAKLFNEYHALFVRVGKDYCRKSKPACGGCPLNRIKL